MICHMMKFSVAAHLIRQKGNFKYSLVKKKCRIKYKCVKRMYMYHLPFLLKEIKMFNRNTKTLELFGFFLICYKLICVSIVETWALIFNYFYLIISTYIYIYFIICILCLVYINADASRKQMYDFL